MLLGLGLLAENVKITQVSGPVTAGTTNVVSSSVDMAADGGWQGVMYVAVFGTGATNNQIKGQSSPDNSTFTDVANSTVPAANSETMQILDMVQPPSRYSQCVVLRGASTTVVQILAIQYKGRNAPYNNASSSKAVTMLAQPTN